MILDALDGRVARLTHTESDFGAQYDSLVDMVSFGLAPALIMYEWALSGMGKLGWLAAFIYAAGAGLRLARFNVQVGTGDKRYFRGLPSPSAAALVVGFIWVLHTYGVPGREISILAMLVTVAAGILMVSNVRLPQFQGPESARTRAVRGDPDPAAGVRADLPRPAAGAVPDLPRLRRLRPARRRP